MLQSKADPSAPIVPDELLRAGLHWWWVLILAALLGGVFGLLLHSLQQPVYQAQSVITVNVDFSRTGPLTDVEEDYMILVVGGAIRSDEVTEEALAQAQLAGYSLDRGQFDEMRALQRSFTEWLLIVRHPDPVTAAALANIWGDAAWAILEEAYLHTLKADQLQRYLDAQVSCLQAVEADQTAPESCSLDSAAEIQAQIDEAADLLQREKLAAKGLVPGTMLNYGQQAHIPNQPVLGARNTLVLAGGMLGLLISAVFVFIRAPRRSIKETD